MTTFECRKCKNTFDKSTREKHELICLYSMHIDNDEICDIPCEKCGKQVQFDLYAQHINMCGIDQQLVRDMMSNIDMHQNGMSFSQFYGRPPSTPINTINEESMSTDTNEYNGPVIETTHIEFNENEEEDLLDNIEQNVKNTIDDIKTLMDKMVTHGNQSQQIQDIKHAISSLNMEQSSANIDNKFQVFSFPIFPETSQTSQSSNPLYIPSIANMPSSIPITPRDFRNMYNSATYTHPALTDLIETDNEFPSVPEPINSNHYLELLTIKNSLSSEAKILIYGSNGSSGSYGSYGSNIYNRHSSYNSNFNQPIRPYINRMNNSFDTSLLPDELRGLADYVMIANQQNQNQRRFRRTIYSVDSDRGDNGESYADFIALGERIGNVEIGITDIETVAPSYILAEGEQGSCSICQEPDKDASFRKVICDHSDVIFCNDCITHWLSTNRKCPICMKNLEDIYNETIGKVSHIPLSPVNKISQTMYDYIPYL